MLASTPWAGTAGVNDVEFVDRCLNAQETSYDIRVRVALAIFYSKASWAHWEKLNRRNNRPGARVVAAG